MSSQPAVGRGAPGATGWGEADEVSVPKTLRGVFPPPLIQEVRNAASAPSTLWSAAPRAPGLAHCAADALNEQQAEAE